MTALITDPAAAVVVVVDASEQASLSEIARATERPVSTIQRAVEGLLEANVLQRTSRRGPVCFAANAPRRALRELAEWRLGSSVAGDIVKRIQVGEPANSFAPPATVRNPAIRRAWADVMNTIVAACDPARVVVFGSQARGDARSDSDLDLLVVFDEVGDRRERRVELRRLMNHQPFAKDVLVASREDVAKPPFGSALAEALREGVTVYER